jgi:hypothetical protein
MTNRESRLDSSRLFGFSFRVKYGSGGHPYLGLWDISLVPAICRDQVPDS